MVHVSLNGIAECDVDRERTLGVSGGLWVSVLIRVLELKEIDLPYRHRCVKILSPLSTSDGRTGACCATSQWWSGADTFQDGGLF